MMDEPRLERPVDLNDEALQALLSMYTRQTTRNLPVKNIARRASIHALILSQQKHE